MMNRRTRRPGIGGRFVAAGFLAVAVGALDSPRVRAQQPAGSLEFDAVSVKPSDPNSRDGTVVSVTKGGTLHVVNATLTDLIETAYEVRRFQIEGAPKWADNAKYNVDATPGGRASSAAAAPPGWTNVRLKVQALLKDRFQLQLHKETKTVPVYSLAVAKGGVKSSGLAISKGGHKGINAGQGTMLGEGASMKDLAEKLSRWLQRPVVNDTALDGNFDFRLEWTPDSAPSAPDGRPAETSIGPSLFSAIQQQLGLRLQATKGPVDVLVIDRVDRPSEN
jgi:uncharacterized protein (TIGR03435 family)